MILNVAENFQR